MKQYWSPPVALFAGSPARVDAFYSKLTQPPAAAKSAE